MTEPSCDSATPELLAKLERDFRRLVGPPPTPWAELHAEIASEAFSEHFGVVIAELPTHVVQQSADGRLIFHRAVGLSFSLSTPLRIRWVDGVCSRRAATSRPQHALSPADLNLIEGSLPNDLQGTHLSPACTSFGQYDGVIRKLTDGVAIQETERGRAVGHRRAQLPKKLDFGAPVRLRYLDGTCSVPANDDGELQASRSA